ncbi:MAG: hypothetical protein Q9160_002946 [Pyrenula sp. 1 TL-2023]
MSADVRTGRNKSQGDTDSPGQGIIYIGARDGNDYEEEEAYIRQSQQKSICRDGFARLPSSNRALSFQPGHHKFQEQFTNSFLNDDPIKIAIHGNTELQDFLSEKMDANTSLWDLVVLTGLATSSWATTCGEYISKLWPKYTDTIAETIAWLQRPYSGRSLVYYLGSYDALKLSVQPGEDHCVTRKGLSFQLNGRPSHCAPVLEAITWLCSVLRTSSSDKVEESVLSLDDVSDRDSSKFQISLRPTVSISSLRSSCWRPLFPQTVTAIDFPVPIRHPLMHGLKVSFDLLCNLCGLEYERVEQGGVVLYGAESIVYPIWQEADSVQWHFEPRAPLSGMSEAIGMDSSRLMIDDLEVLKISKRHFLGLWADCRVTLGTDRSDLTGITWSKSQEVRKERISDSMTIGGLLVMPRLITLTASKTYKYAKGRKSNYSTNFEGKMASLMDVPAMLYSPSERRCWMVPILSVILHLARVRANHQSDLGINIPPCRLDSSGGKAALQIIQQFCRSPWRDDWFGEDERRKEQAEFIQDYINQVWIALDCASRETYTAKRYFKTEILGYEMADIAKVKTRLQMKRHQLKNFSGSWTPLLNEVDLALFCEGLDDPIIPWLSEDRGSACMENNLKVVPRGHDLLLATIPCLRYFAERYND